MHGFDLDPGELHKLADEMATFSQDLHAIRSGWDRTTTDGAQSFATTDCGQAFEGVYRSMLNRLKEKQGTFDELSKNLRDSANSYRSDDRNIGQSFGGAL